MSPAVPARSAMSAVRVVGTAGRLENQLLRATTPALRTAVAKATAGRLRIQLVRATAPALRAASAMAANLSVEPGGPEQQAISAVPLRSRFPGTARPRTCA